MKLSTDRILTTHVGSLPRPQDVVDLIFAQDREEKLEREAAMTTKELEEKKAAEKKEAQTKKKVPTLRREGDPVAQQQIEFREGKRHQPLECPGRALAEHRDRRDDEHRGERGPV